MKKFFITIIVVVIIINILFLVPFTKEYILNGIDIITSSVTGTATNINESSSIKDKNEELQKKNDELKKENEELTNKNIAIEEQNKELTKNSGSNDTKKYDIIDAKVKHRVLDSWNQVLIINKGSNDGIKKGNPVTVDGKMIGYISKVDGKTSEVTLLTSPSNRFSIPVKIVGDEKTSDAVVNSYNSEKGTLELSPLYLDSSVKEGDKVYTNGYGKNQPGDIYLGEISTIKESKSNAKYYLDLDLSHFDYVSVVIDEK